MPSSDPIQNYWKQFLDECVGGSFTAGVLGNLIASGVQAVAIHAWNKLQLNQSDLIARSSCFGNQHLLRALALAHLESHIALAELTLTKDLQVPYTFWKEDLADKLLTERSRGVHALRKLRRGARELYRRLDALSDDNLQGLPTVQLSDSSGLLRAGATNNPAADETDLRSRATQSARAALPSILGTVGVADAELPPEFRERFAREWFDLYRRAFWEIIKSETPPGRAARRTFEIDVLASLPEQMRIGFDALDRELTIHGAQLEYLIGGLPIRRFELPDPPTRELELLYAKHRAVPLVGRDTDLDALSDWVESPETISARLLVGGAGTGKTRLAYELLLRVNTELRDWQAGVLDDRNLRRLVDKVHSTDFNWPAPTLFVVDYALTLAAQLTRLFLALTHKRKAGLPPLRILLLEREAGDWFDSLLRAEDSDGPCPVRSLFFPPAPVRLTPLPPGELRRQVLAHALEKSAQVTGQRPVKLPPPGNVDYDQSLQRDIFNQPLNLMLAALAATDMGLLPALKRERIELAEALADKELRRVERFARDPDNSAQKRVLRHLAGCATLQRGFAAKELDRAVDEELAALGIHWRDGPGDLAQVLRKALGSKHLPVAPVAPDFVGEALVLRALAGTDGKSPDGWRNWCSTVERCCRRDLSATPVTLLHAFQNFGLQYKYGKPLLAATDALICAGLADKEPALLAGIENAIPHQTVRLRSRAVEITRHLYERLKTTMEAGRDELKPEVARLANNLGVRLSEMGQHEKALIVTQKSVEWYRTLPDTFAPYLARSLNNLANRLGAVGRRTEALAPAQESLELRRALARESPDAFMPDLARSLNNLAGRLIEVGRRVEALALVQEATALYRMLANKYADTFGPALAMSLNNLATSLSAVNERAAALVPAQEAVDLYRTLDRQNPDAFRPELALSLNNLANRLSETGRRADACAVAQEAVESYRNLARQNSDAFRPDLAMSLSNLAIFLNEIGRGKEALDLAHEAVELRRTLAQQNSNAFAPDLALSLRMLGHTLECNDRRADALASFAEGLRVLSPHFRTLPAVHALVMQELRRGYLRIAQALNQPPDDALLGPVDEILARLQS